MDTNDNITLDMAATSLDVKGPFYSGFLEKKRDGSPAYGPDEQACIEHTVAKLRTADATKPIILLGKIQSGKTKAFLGIAALAFDGWDTHAKEGGPVGRLAQLLSGLDGALAEFESGLGARWRDTVVVVATEFGRTARINGTEGTDHGTGTIALLAGGAVKGGRVISDWPGLKPASLYEGRDLAPTTDLRAVLKGVLHDHLGLAERVLAQTVFPDSAPVKPMQGLVG